MRNIRLLPVTAFLTFALLLAACRGSTAAEPATIAPMAVASPTVAPPAVAPTAAAIATAAATPIPAPTATTLAVPARPGAEYVLLLPRESAVPSDWLMNPAPSYRARQPSAGEIYRFACEDLTARSVGRASVGYRHLEGLPSIYIEYVIYPTAEDAAAALADMEMATDHCLEFEIGEGNSATTAAFNPLDFPAYGDSAFARTLMSNSPVTGDLLTHMIKVLHGHVVIGVNQTVYAGTEPPDAALTESLVALAVSNLAAGPSAPGR